MLTRLFKRKLPKTMSSISETRRQEIDRILKQVDMDNFKQVEEIISQDQLDKLLMSYQSGQ